MDIQKKTLIRPVINKTEFEAIETVVGIARLITENNNDTDLIVGVNGEFMSIKDLKNAGSLVETLMNNLVVSD